MIKWELRYCKVWEKDVLTVVQNKHFDEAIQGVVVRSLSAMLKKVFSDFNYERLHNKTFNNTICFNDCISFVKTDVFELIKLGYITDIVETKPKTEKGIEVVSAIDVYGKKGQKVGSKYKKSKEKVDTIYHDFLGHISCDNEKINAIENNVFLYLYSRLRSFLGQKKHVVKTLYELLDNNTEISIFDTLGIVTNIESLSQELSFNSSDKVIRNNLYKNIISDIDNSKYKDEIYTYLDLKVCGYKDVECLDIMSISKQHLVTIKKVVRANYLNGTKLEKVKIKKDGSRSTISISDNEKMSYTDSKRFLNECLELWYNELQKARKKWNDIERIENHVSYNHKQSVEEGIVKSLQKKQEQTAIDYDNCHVALAIAYGCNDIYNLCKTYNRQTLY